MITAQKALADFFERAVALGAPAKQVSNWIMGEVMGQLSARGLEAQVTQIWAARSKGAGGLNLMMGQNPVWLISGRRREEEA